ncbi:MAG: polysaccharide deacetylase family protein [Opitutae bacterium]|nr:polysaccharide deacetylase family protein [Opitutae bacterium]
MTLLVLMYHRAQTDRFGNDAAMLDAHFAYLRRHYACILPGEPLDPQRLNVCLTFDDAYYDFFAVAYPLLSKHGLCAVLAVSPGLIIERVEAVEGTRLALSSYDAYAYPERGGLCTWTELRQLALDPRIAFAAHGRTHVRLDNYRADLSREIADAKTVLQERLCREVNSFVYPFGGFNAETQVWARKFYRHVFRIGQASNRGWQAPLLYRVVADGMSTPESLFTPARLLRYRCNALWNRARGV